jgi:uncharacterized glyoxalase superfamily protein PhnB
LRTNRSIPPCPVIPVLCYPDPSQAAEWMARAFGFSLRVRIASHRIQMHAGPGCFTIAHGAVAPNRSCIIQVRVEDASTHCEHARSEGATIVAAPTDHVYGEQQYTAEDFYGHTWSFTETIADVNPESWGGVSVALRD